MAEDDPVQDTQRLREDLVAFRKPAAEEKGVSATAKSLQMLPSKVSLMLKTLEDEGLVAAMGRRSDPEAKPATGAIRR